MMSNSFKSNIPEFISFEKPVSKLASCVKFELTEGPKHITKEVGSKRKAKTVRRGYKKSHSRLASAMAKGKAKAKARARARAVARAELDLHHMEPSLGPDIFAETDSESDSVSELTHQVIFNDDWITWHEEPQQWIEILDEDSAMIRECLESHMIDL